VVCSTVVVRLGHVRFSDGNVVYSVVSVRLCPVLSSNGIVMFGWVTVWLGAMRLGSGNER
jgi:hypothetical protein